MPRTPAQKAAKEIAECVEEFLKREGWISRETSYEHAQLEDDMAAIIEKHQPSTLFKQTPQGEHE